MRQRPPPLRAAAVLTALIALVAFAAQAAQRLPAADDWDARAVEALIRDGDLDQAKLRLTAEFQALAQGPCTNTRINAAIDAMQLRALVLLFDTPTFQTADGAALRKKFIARDSLVEEWALTLGDQDQPDQAARIIALLNAKIGNTALTQASLLTAFALVWDTPPTNTWYRNKMDDDRLVAAFRRDLDKMSAAERAHPARLLSFQTYSALSADDWTYVDNHYAAHRDNPARAYTDIRYDLNFFTRGTPKKIDSLPYTLANIKQSGGVCLEQAYHTRGVCHALGVPAVLIAGSGSSGIGHAWVGYLKPGSPPAWDFTVGTSPAGNFTVGEFADPQTGQWTTNLDLLAEMPELIASRQDRRRAAAAARVIATRARLDTSFAPEVLVWARASFEKIPTHRATWNSLLEYLEKVPGAADGQLAEILTHLAKLGPDHPEIMLARFDRLHAAIEKNGQPFNLRHYDKMNAAVAGNEGGQVALETRLAREEELAGKRSSAAARLLKIVQAHPRAGNSVLAAADDLARMWRTDQKDSLVLPMYLDLLAANKLTRQVSPEVMSMTMHFRLGQRLIVEYKRLGRDEDAATLQKDIQAHIGQ